MDTEQLAELFALPTIERYKELAKAQNEPELIEQLPHGGEGREAAGGGSIAMAYDAYKAAQAQAQALDDNVALAILAYDTCAVAPYPTQLAQTVSFVEYLLQGRDPEDIELFGDSAGGTLIIALLLHLSHPHPKVPPFSLPAGHKLGRILLISPSGPVVTSAASMTSNLGKDFITPDMLRHMWGTIEANHDPDVELVNPWLTPALKLDESWYRIGRLRGSRS
ncbi:hypothetical protein VTN77DRAFT_1081 [Rasamsonia byssochlamydoides]|uniref:uncharacterized protein n=1 Tax=Rasamsonia byssochlamydoides TaxID=89139 RepID=UPI003742EA1E